VRVAVADTPGLDRLRLGVGVLLALAAGISAWLTWMVTSWNRRVGVIEAALADGASGLPLTGLRELDRLVTALDTANARLATARERAAANDRLAALGRVAAGVAHEIRNPVAAMRLRAENALEGDPARRGVALEDVLRQVARLDQLIAELLEMTQRREPRVEPVDLAAFLRQCASDSGLDEVTVASDIATARFDPVMLGRVLAILLDNVRRHAPGSPAHLSARRDGDGLVFDISDEGPGIAASLRGALFEPFVTGRADGTGLGLAIARELAQAHGGTLTVLASEKGAAFRLIVPWQIS
jgi:signal transduction histidine kinase